MSSAQPTAAPFTADRAATPPTQRPITQAAIIAGGQGTRIRSISGDDIPKALVPLAGQPIIHYQLRLLARYGVRRLAIVAGYLADALRAGVEPLARQLGLETAFFVEPAPLGTAGGLPAAQDFLGGDDFFVLYGDLALEMDLGRLAAFHRRHEALITVVAHPNDHPHNSDLLRLDDRQRIVEVLPRRRREPGHYRNMVPAAVYCLSPAALDHIRPGVKEDFINDVLPRLAAAGRAMAYNTPEYLRDMGTVERYALAERDIHSGLLARMNLATPRPAVFFDRDGVLVRDYDGAGVVFTEQLELLPGAAEAVRMVNQAGWLALVVSNQPQVAKGYIDLAGLDAIHAKLETLLGQAGAKLDRIYFCPHHPDKGFPGEVPELKIECNCRKPQPGMIRQALADMTVDVARSCLIGDRRGDVGAARAMGLRAYGVRTGHACRDCQAPAQPDHIFDGVLDAVRYALVDSGQWSVVS